MWHEFSGCTLLKNAVPRHSNDRTSSQAARSTGAGSNRQLPKRGKERITLRTWYNPLCNARVQKGRDMNGSLISCNVEYFLYPSNHFYRRSLSSSPELSASNEP